MPLVDALPEKGTTPASDSDDSGASVKLWGGIDPRTLAAIRAALGESHIAYDDAVRENRLLSIYSPEPLQIWIHRPDEEAAREILEGVVGDAEAAGITPDAEMARNAEGVNPFMLHERLFAGAPEEEDVTSEEDVAQPEASGGPAPDDLVEDFDPEDATCEVWAGADKRMAQIFKDCLQNVGIGSVASKDGGKTRILVLPSVETRAREVIREIVEQAPPE
ncbi:MAG: hypothetical protein ACLP1Y_17220 [Candidatus Acidiferrales bacterium]